jgi:hypothetical protein
MQDCIEIVILDDSVKCTCHSDILDDRKLELALVNCSCEFVAQIGCLALCPDSRDNCMSVLEKNDDDVHGDETVAAGEENVARHVEEDEVYEGITSRLSAEDVAL